MWRDRGFTGYLSNRQPHLPRVEIDYNKKSKYLHTFIGRITEIFPETGMADVRAEKEGRMPRVRLMHRAFNGVSGSVKFPDISDTDNPPEVTMQMVDGNTEDVVAGETFHWQGLSPLLKRIADAKAEDTEKPYMWIDKHPSGSEILHHGDGSIEIITAKGTKIILNDTDKEESIDITAIEDANININLTGNGEFSLNTESNMILKSTGNDAKISIEVNELNLICNESIKAGIQNLVNKICNEKLLIWLKSHTHISASSGSPTSPATQPIVEATVLTNEFKAS